MESFALNVTGQDQSGEEIFLVGRWGTWKGGLGLPHRPGYVVPGNAGGLVAGLLLPERPFVTAREPLSHRGRVVTVNERVVVREIEVTC